MTSTKKQLQNQAVTTIRGWRKQIMDFEITKNQVTLEELAGWVDQINSVLATVGHHPIRPSHNFRADSTPASRSRIHSAVERMLGEAEMTLLKYPPKDPLPVKQVSPKEPLIFRRRRESMNVKMSATSIDIIVNTYFTSIAMMMDESFNTKPETMKRFRSATGTARDLLASAINHIKKTAFTGEQLTITNLEISTAFGGVAITVKTIEEIKHEKKRDHRIIREYTVQTCGQFHSGGSSLVRLGTLADTTGTPAGVVEAGSKIMDMMLGLK